MIGSHKSPDVARRTLEWRSNVVMEVMENGDLFVGSMNKEGNGRVGTGVGDTFSNGGSREEGLELIKDGIMGRMA